MDNKEMFEAIGRVYMEKTAEMQREVGELLEKNALLFSFINQAKPMGLMKAEQAMMRDYYGLKPDTDLRRLAFRRGAIGETIGGTTAGLAGYAITPDAIEELPALVGVLASMNGAQFGSHVATEPFSRRSMNRIISDYKTKQLLSNQAVNPETVKSLNNV